MQFRNNAIIKIILNCKTWKKLYTRDSSLYNSWNSGTQLILQSIQPVKLKLNFCKILRITKRILNEYKNLTGYPQGA